MNESNLLSPFVFACGVPRSGTTLLQRMLNSHPLLAVANDSHFIPRALELTNKALIKEAENGTPIELTPELAANVQNYHRFWRLEISAAEFESVKDESSTFQELVAGLYVVYARQHGKQLGGEKTPDYLRRLRLLNGMFPKSKLIHIIRDGRSVALSLRQWAKPDKGPGRLALWHQHPTAVCALWWRWMVMEAREQAATIDASSYFEIRYEDVVEAPEQNMRDVCKFLEIAYSPQMLEYHQGRSQPADSLSAKSAWLAPQTGLRNWKNDMASEEIELFEVLAADALQANGYQLHSTRHSDQTLETARKCQAWWDENFMPKHQAINRPKPPAPNEPHDARLKASCSSDQDSSVSRLGKLK